MASPALQCMRSSSQQQGQQLLQNAAVGHPLRAEFPAA
jgi:hypothetical protein